MRLVQGIGINDANYIVQPTIDGKQVMCKIYDTWYQMLRRCYNTKEQDRPRNRSYIGCSVDERWLHFMEFKTWYDSQDKSQEEKMVLDKDILIPNNKIYSPDACLLVPEYLNKFFISKGKDTNGVGVWKDKYRARIAFKGKCLNLGLFETEEEALSIFNQKFKDLILVLADEYKSELPKLYSILINKLSQL